MIVPNDNVTEEIKYDGKSFGDYCFALYPKLRQFVSLQNVT